jgi:hypothetical protein
MKRNRRNNAGVSDTQQAPAEQAPNAEQAPPEQTAEAARTVTFCFPLTAEAAPVIEQRRFFPPGIRPVALKAISEIERMRACPHRAQAAANWRRALRIGGSPPART